MKGYILSESAYLDKWDVLFSIKPWHDEDFSVHQDDLELVEVQ